MASGSFHYVITVVCDDKPGIVHAVSGAVVSAEGNIEESQQFSSEDTGRFFMRLQVETTADYASFSRALEPVIERYGMEVQINEVGRALRTLILTSTAGHCLTDLLVRQRDGHLRIDIVEILANHDTLRPVADFYGVPFRSLPTTDSLTKEKFEAEVLNLVRQHDIELVVLARYMQILSPRLCEELEGRVINIHHSFLPGFTGANPYRQAHERGVKLIGATAHFVTKDLDEGPIIEQNVVRVDHSRSADELRAIGQDEESRTLTHAVRWCAEHRILRDGARTIVFT
jgi:formyltetrahydrofolate deformylase